MEDNSKSRKLHAIWWYHTYHWSRSSSHVFNHVDWIYEVLSLLCSFEEEEEEEPEDLCGLLCCYIYSNNSTLKKLNPRIIKSNYAIKLLRT